MWHFPLKRQDSAPGTRTQETVPHHQKKNLHKALVQPHTLGGNSTNKNCNYAACGKETLNTVNKQHEKTGKHAADDKAW